MGATHAAFKSKLTSKKVVVCVYVCVTEILRQFVGYCFSIPHTVYNQSTHCVNDNFYEYTKTSAAFLHTSKLTNTYTCMLPTLLL